VVETQARRALDARFGPFVHSPNGGKGFLVEGNLNPESLVLWSVPDEYFSYSHEDETVAKKAVQDWVDNRQSAGCQTVGPSIMRADGHGSSDFTYEATALRPDSIEPTLNPPTSSESRPATLDQ